MDHSAYKPRYLERLGPRQPSVREYFQPARKTKENIVQARNQAKLLDNTKTNAKVVDNKCTKPKNNSDSLITIHPSTAILHNNEHELAKDFVTNNNFDIGTSEFMDGTSAIKSPILNETRHQFPKPVPADCFSKIPRVQSLSEHNMDLLRSLDTIRGWSDNKHAVNPNLLKEIIDLIEDVQSSDNDD